MQGSESPSARSARYRRLANECLDIARTFPKGARRTVLLQMAQVCSRRRSGRSAIPTSIPTTGITTPPVLLRLLELLLSLLLVIRAAPEGTRDPALSVTAWAGFSFGRINSRSAHHRAAFYFPICAFSSLSLSTSRLASFPTSARRYCSGCPMAISPTLRAIN
jgi:hypothetical protein